MKTSLTIFLLFTLGYTFSQTPSTFNYTDTCFYVGQQKTLNVVYGMVKVLYSEKTKPTNLIELAKFLNAHPNIKIEIIRHTDSRGSTSANLTLTQKQAEATKFYLVNHHKVNPNQIIPIGKGESEPIYTEKEINKYKITDKTKFEQMHQANRRTVIKIIEV